jgi:hypothetical protein
VGAATRIGLLMVGVALLVCVLSGPAKSEPVVPPAPAGLAFVTGNGKAPDQVAVASSSGAGQRTLGPGDDPLLSPDGTHVAVSLFGLGAEKGPALGVYAIQLPVAATTYLDLAQETVQPLAFSHDSRYLAVSVRSTSLKQTVAKSWLGVLDTQTGAITTIAHGAIEAASFSPDGRDQLVFSKSSTEFGGPTDLWLVQATGAGLQRLTRDGRSLNPVWGAQGIAYDRQRLRHNDAPVFQIWLRPDPARPPQAPRRITSLRIPPLLDGLVPLAFSADGTRLLAEFEGQDTSEAWTVDLSTGRARRLRSHGRTVLGDGISADGSTLLIEEGWYETPASKNRIATLPFGGGAARVLVAHGSSASWNR